MANKKRKERVKNKLRKQREAALDRRRVEREAGAVVVDHKEKLKPILKPETRDARIKRQLQANLQILKALEQQYLEEVKNRQANGENMEGDTIREKIENAIKAVSEQQELLDKLNNQKQLLEKINSMVDEEENDAIVTDSED